MKFLLLSDSLTSKLPRSIPWLALHQSWVVSVGCQCLSSLLFNDWKGRGFPAATGSRTISLVVIMLELTGGISDGVLAVVQQSLDEGYRIKMDKGFWGRGPLLAPSYIHVWHSQSQTPGMDFIECHSIPSIPWRACALLCSVCNLEGLDYIVPFMISVLMAKAVGDSLNEGPALEVLIPWGALRATGTDGFPLARHLRSADCAERIPLSAWRAGSWANVFGRCWDPGILQIMSCSSPNL